MSDRWCLTIACILTATIVGGASADDDPAALDALLKECRSLGLPHPPPDAKLVQYEAGGHSVINGVVQPPQHYLAFQVGPEKKGEEPALFIGTETVQSGWHAHVTPIAPKDVLFMGPDPVSNNQLLLAIECHARGWDELAVPLLKRSKLENETPPSDRLVELAWKYWEGRIAKPKIDRAPVARRLKDLMARDKKLDDPGHRALVKSLELALIPSKAKPGSVEALIDDLVDFESDTGVMHGQEPEERYWRIARLGFDAVPELIKHLDDERLTRGRMIGFNNFHTWNLRVQHVVGDLLNGVAGEELMRGANGEDVGGDWLRRQQGYAVTPAAAAKWWEGAQKIGEKAYVLERVIPPPSKEKDKQPRISDHLLALIEARYPEEVLPLYRKVLDDRPELNSWGLSEAVLRSKAPVKEKRDLFLRAAGHPEKEHRLPALRAIAKVDKKQFASLVIASIEAMPADVAGAYWVSSEVRIANLTFMTDDPRAWQALEKTAKRSVVGLRMELLNHFLDDDDRHRADRLRLWAKFLDDDTLREMKASEEFGGKFAGPCAAFTYPKIEVRDFAALQIGYTLGMDIPLRLDWTPADWAILRNDVKTALRRELEKTK
jgi:hypothetical protein